MGNRYRAWASEGVIIRSKVRILWKVFRCGIREIFLSHQVTWCFRSTSSITLWWDDCISRIDFLWDSCNKKSIAIASDISHLHEKNWRRYRWIFKNKNVALLLRGCQCIYEIRKFKLKIASVLTASFSARRPQYDFCWVERTKTPSQFYVQYQINWLPSRLSQAYLWGSSADWCCAHEDTRVCLFQRIERLYMTWGIWSLLHQFFSILEILAHT